MQRVALGQLSLDAAPKGAQRGMVLTANISVKGKLLNAPLPEYSESEIPELSHGEMVVVTVADMDGEIIGQAHGKVAIAFTDKTVEGVELTIREQKITV
jgi:hypothetical protein